jgi:hypothetical protein
MNPRSLRNLVARGGVRGYQASALGLAFGSLPVAETDSNPVTLAARQHGKSLSRPEIA